MTSLTEYDAFSTIIDKAMSVSELEETLRNQPAYELSFHWTQFE